MLTPNIDLPGRRARAIGGIILLLVSLSLAFFLPRPWTVAFWIAVFTPTVGGLFMLFEARRGWCAVRACGIKTSI